MMTRQMKSSGVEWIGDIPEKWDVCKVINCLLNIGSGTTPQGLEYYENEYIPWLNTGDLNDAYIERTEKSVSEKALSDYSVLKRFDKGSVVVAMYGATVGKLGIVSFPLVTNQACCVMTPNEKLYNMFLFYLFMAGKTHLISLSLGSGQPNINQNTVKTFDIPFPSFSEQKEIADYLDAKCAKIDAFIAKQKTVIEKLKEYKQSVITEAVTKGLNPAAPMKTSGVEWIGEIPENWDVKKLKYAFEIKKDIAGKEGYTVLSITQTGIKPKNITSNEGQLANDYSNYQLVNNGDFAMNHMDLLTGWVDISKYDGVTSPDYRVFRLKDMHNCDKYFLYMMQLCYLNKIFYGLGQGVSGFGRWRLPAEMFLNFLIPIPSLSEQKKIADYLDKKCAKIDVLIEKKQQFLTELATYKKSMIYEYVTGKKEVA